jgi:DNA repair protein RadD
MLDTADTLSADLAPLSFDEVDELDLSEAIDVQQGPPPMRAHQTRAEAAILAHFAEGARRVIACGPTGCGKSRLGRAIADRFAEPGAVCLTHTRPLYKQNARTICRTVMVQQLVLAAKEGQLDSLLDRIGPVGLVIEDEGHHLAADGWKIVHDIPRWKVPSVKRLGLSATPMRGDGKPLRPYYDHLVKIADYSELIDLGYLVPCVVDRPTGAQARVGRTMRQNAAQAYLVHNGLRAIIFCEDTEHSRATVKELQAAGVRAAHIDGDTPEAVRESLFAAFTDGELEVISNCDVLTEGVDLPCTECVILAKSYKTVGGMLQAAGRGLRACPSTGKTELLLIDLVGATIEFGGPDENRDYKLDGSAMELQPGKVWVCGTCYRNFSPKIVGATAESWTDAGGLLEERELSGGDLEKRGAWCVKKEQAFADKASGEYITERQRRTRVKALRDYTKKLSMQVGAVVQVCSIPGGDEGPKMTPCPHCLRERPRGNAKADLQRVDRMGRPVSSMGPGSFSLEPPPNVGAAVATLAELFDAAMRRGQCLTSVASEYKLRVGKDIGRGYARSADIQAKGKYREYQDKYLDAKIKAGWKPGVKFIRLTKFFAK